VTMPLLSILAAVFASALTDTIQLQAAGVTAKVEPITVQADTVVYNAEAYKLRDDATLEDLLLKIPGLEINGSHITLYGKPVDKLMLNGQDFFGSNPSAGLKNMDAQMIKGIRNYSRESDFTRLTGVDDGEEQNVLDIVVKKSFMDGWKGTVSGGYGTSDRYMARGNANKITKTRQTTAIGGISNLPTKPSMTNTDFNTLGSGGLGDRSRWEAGVNFGENVKQRKISASGHYAGVNGWVEGNNMSESVLPTGSSSSKSENDRRINSHKLDGDFKGEWRFSPKMTLLVHPEVLASRTVTDGSNDKQSYSGSNVLVNTSSALPYSLQDRIQGKLDAHFVRRFEKKGRSGSVRLFLMTDNHLNTNSDSTRITYFKSGVTPYKYDNRTNQVYSNAHNREVFGIVNYSEPLSKKVFLDVFYKLDFRSNLLDRDVTLNGVHSGEMTSSGRYDYFTHTISLTGRYVRKRFRIHAGVNLVPQSSTLHYVTDVTEPGVKKTSVFNAAPKLLLNYRKSKTEYFRLDYSSWTGMPSVYNLIPVTNGTNPLYIHIGNPDLLPSFSQRAKLEYNFSAPKSRQSLVIQAQAQMVSNKTVNSTRYEPETGVRTTMPVNVDGNWNANMSAVYNKSFKGNSFSLNAQLYSGYKNEISYLYNTKLKEDELSRLGRFQANLKAAGVYRNGVLDMTVGAGAQVTDERSFLREDLCQTPWRINADVKAGIYLPFRLKFGVDFTFLMNRGNMYEDFNRNYYIVDAYISQSFFKGKFIVSLTGNDLLNQQENQVRSFSASTRSVTVYNGVSRYALLKLLYRFK